MHHVHGIPIDYDAAFYARAVAAAGSEVQLFSDYFDSQLEMLNALKPKVVGHFDLIRLLAAAPDEDLKMKGEEVWGKVVRNLEVVKKQGGLLEINSAGLRKGLSEPYPGRAICEVFKGMGGRFTLSDDSHGIAQVGTCYARAIGYLEGLGVEEVWTFERGEGGALVEKRVRVEDVKASFRE